MIFRFAGAVCCLGFLSIVAIAADAPRKPAGPPARIVDWIKVQALPVTTVEAGHGFDDLAPLTSKLEGAEVVALGEDTHGSHEVFQMKHRMIEYLVSELGFSIFAIEANMPEARRLNDYVLGQDGDVEALIKGMYFWTWTTTEVRDLVEWMRKFNTDPAQRAAGRHVEFTGFDLQVPDAAAQIAADFLAKYDQPAFRPKIEAAQKAVSSTAEKRESRREAGSMSSVTTDAPPAGKVLALWNEMEARIASITARESATIPAAERAWAQQNAHIVVQGLELSAHQVSRDRSMADNVMWLREQNPGAKIVLWSHNNHVAKRPEAMGGDLAKRLGKHFVVFGFASGHGTYRSRSKDVPAIAEFPLRAPLADSVEEACAAAGVPRFILDLHESNDAASPAWFFNLPRPHRMIGSREMVGRSQFQERTVGQEYDFLIWLNEVRAAEAL